VLAAFLFMHRMAEETNVVLAGREASELQGPIPPGTVVYGIYGPLFFGAAQKAMATLGAIGGETKAVILLMHEVRAMDATGLVALESAVAQLRKHGCLAILCGVRPQPLALLEKSGFTRSPGLLVCSDARDALAAAERHVAIPPRSRSSSAPAG
jgi:sulfate permease, SulP family